MKLNSKITITDIAGEKLALIELDNGKTRAISFNSSSLFLWESLSQREDFSTEDVAALLVEKYGIDAQTARTDASDWVESLKANGLAE